MSRRLQNDDSLSLCLRESVHVIYVPAWLWPYLSAIEKHVVNSGDVEEKTKREG